jgi:hypothetical protein
MPHLRKDNSDQGTIWVLTIFCGFEPLGSLDDLFCRSILDLQCFTTKYRTKNKINLTYPFREFGFVDRSKSNLQCLNSKTIIEYCYKFLTINECLL